MKAVTVVLHDFWRAWSRGSRGRHYRAFRLYYYLKPADPARSFRTKYGPGEADKATIAFFHAKVCMVSNSISSAVVLLLYNIFRIYHRFSHVPTSTILGMQSQGVDI